MNECPYCYAAVGPTDALCPKCGKEIERWQTGFYTRQPLATRKKTAVWAIAAFALLLVLTGFAKACHWI